MESSGGGLYVFPLTPLTRGASAQRRVVFAGFDLSLRTLIVAGIGAIPGLVLAMMLWVLLGVYGFIAVAISEAVTFVLFEGRSNRGLKLKVYQTMWDKKRAEVGRFFLCGKEIQPGQSVARTIVVSSVPLDKGSREAAPMAEDKGLQRAARSLAAETAATAGRRRSTKPRRARGSHSGDGWAA